MSEYCLRWNNHRPNLVTVFSELLTSEALVDVTLATDGHYIHAHKLVLSACSVYFKDLFRANPCKHPIVILKDIRIDDLKTVIDFIYRGEVNVAQDRLQDVLKTAESLRIKGLAENPRSYDEMSSHGARFSQSSIGSQVTRQRSSLTDSREQSSSLEGEEEAEPGTPPSTKRRKITPSHDSSESVHEETENDNKACSYEVKDEPVDDRENERSQSRGGEQESNVNRVADAMLMLQGVSSDNADESGNTPGTSSDSTLTSSHSQGSVCRWGAGDPPSLESLLAGPYTPPGPPTPASSPPHQILPPSPLSPSPLLPYPMHPPPPTYISPKSWPPQFRRMSPNMLMAIEAVRAGKMGFTQAGKTYGVNGRTLWVYYRKLGYEVHNTFRGKRQKTPENQGSLPVQVEMPVSPCAGSSQQETVANTIVTVDDDMPITTTAANNQITEATLADALGPEQQTYPYVGHQSAPPEIPNDDSQVDDSSRTLQSLLETFNLRNIWTSQI
ncbi:protein bric-a-brac 2-like isoform X3 [Penaeus chinensis]|uniref:protein bric-a-brac 2-like isoform X3 n=1 Tax=Penaeus chinensis TaxID=139456 RepID=UPI001FB83924|nr:protein bric-a-brac 2-like isoform X3 [Penaeus chinensis]